MCTLASSGLQKLKICREIVVTESRILTLYALQEGFFQANSVESLSICAPSDVLPEYISQFNLVGKKNLLLLSSLVLCSEWRHSKWDIWPVSFASTLLILRRMLKWRFNLHLFCFWAFYTQNCQRSWCAKYLFAFNRFFKSLC